jgi:hypothetical protein
MPTGGALMQDDERARRERAERLRRQIERLKSEKTNGEQDEDPKMRPDESPKDYVERREREISRKKKE